MQYYCINCRELKTEGDLESNKEGALKCKSGCTKLQKSTNKHLVSE